MAAYSFCSFLHAETPGSKEPQIKRGTYRNAAADGWYTRSANRNTKSTKKSGGPALIGLPHVVHSRCDLFSTPEFRLHPEPGNPFSHSHNVIAAINVQHFAGDSACHT